MYTNKNYIKQISYFRINKLILLLVHIILIFTFFSCEENSRKGKVLLKTDTSKIEIKNFFKNNKSITENSFKSLYNLISEDYKINRGDSNYKLIIIIANKALKTKNLKVKNLQYSDLKTQYLKNK